MSEKQEYIFERIQVCVDEAMGVGLDRVKPSSRLSADLGADSLDAVEIVMRVEEEFGFMIEDEDYDKFVKDDAPLSEMEVFIRQRMEA